MSKNEQNCRNFCKKMKFKTRLVAGNGIWPAKIRPKGPVSPLELSCKIFRPHLKNSLKKSKKIYPPPQKKKRAFFFWGGGSGDRWSLRIMCLGLKGQKSVYSTSKHMNFSHQEPGRKFAKTRVHQTPEHKLTLH